MSIKVEEYIHCDGCNIQDLLTTSSRDRYAAVRFGNNYDEKHLCPKCSAYLIGEMLRRLLLLEKGHDWQLSQLLHDKKEATDKQ